MPSNEDVRIGLRLRAAREQLGLTKRDIAQRVGFGNYQTLSSIEDGTRAIKVSELSRLCDIYHKDMRYFISQESPPELDVRLTWRAKNPNTDYRDIESRIRAVIENQQLLEHLIGEKLGRFASAWDSSTRLRTFEDVQSRATEVVADLGLGCLPASCLADTMEHELNIRIVYYDLGEFGSGLTAEHDDGVTVFVNASDIEGRRNFDLAHELFHIYSSKVYPLSDADVGDKESRKRVEVLANVFASALLMPRDALIAEFDMRVKDSKIAWLDIIRIAQEFKVSTKALLWRLKDVAKLPEQIVKKLIDSSEFGELNRKVRGQTSPAPHFSERFVWLGLKALREGKISKGKFCKIFEISRPEFHSFLPARGYTEETIYDVEIEVCTT